MQCNKANYRRNVGVRENIIFNVYSHTPISILVYAIEGFLEEEKMQLK